LCSCVLGFRLCVLVPMPSSLCSRPCAISLLLLDSCKLLPCSFTGTWLCSHAHTIRRRTSQCSRPSALGLHSCTLAPLFFRLCVAFAPILTRSGGEHPSAFHPRRYRHPCVIPTGVAAGFFFRPALSGTAATKWRNPPPLFRSFSFRRDSLQFPDMRGLRISPSIQIDDVSVRSRRHPPAALPQQL
jgi:hypothetical protein